MKEILDRIFERNRLNRRLHWTTIASEKVLLAIIGLLSVIASGQYIWGMFEVGVIDPAKVTRSTLQNAASIASMVLTTECIIVDKPNEENSMS